VQDETPTSSLGTWTPQEKWVWEQVRQGKIADFNKADWYGGQLDPKEPKGWPEGRILRPEFLKAILLDEELRKAIPHLGVRIVGVRIRDPLDLSHATLGHPMWLEDSRFDSVVDLTSLRTPHWFSLVGSVFTSPVIMPDIRVGASLYMSRSTFADVNLGIAKVEGQLTLVDATVSGDLNMNGLEVNGCTPMCSVKERLTRLQKSKNSGQNI